MSSDLSPIGQNEGQKWTLSECWLAQITPTACKLSCWKWWMQLWRAVFSSMSPTSLGLRTLPMSVFYQLISNTPIIQAKKDCFWKVFVLRWFDPQLYRRSMKFKTIRVVRMSNSTCIIEAVNTTESYTFQELDTLLNLRSNLAQFVGFSSSSPTESHTLLWNVLTILKFWWF